jgi:hypothetical protein
LSNFLSSKPWIWIRIRIRISIDKKCWFRFHIRIRIGVNADLRHIKPLFQKQFYSVKSEGLAKDLEQEVVGVVAVVDGGDGVQDGAAQHHRLALQEHRLQHLNAAGGIKLSQSYIEITHDLLLFSVAQRIF